MVWNPLKDSGLTPDSSGFYTYTVPATTRVSLDFSVLDGTYWENAVVVYSRQTLEPIIERGNYDRSLDQFISDNSASGSPLDLLFTAWHKNSPPDSDEPWSPSTRMKADAAANVKILGWHDNNDPTDSFASNITVRIIVLD
jgi:hypothetical protein